MSRIISFQLFGDTFGIELMKVKEVYRFKSIDEVNGTKEEVFGMINVRGSITTLLNLSMLLNVKMNSSININKCIILKKDYNSKNRVGLVIEKLEDIIDSTNLTEHFLVKDEKQKYDYIKKIYIKDDRNKDFLMILDIDKVLMNFTNKLR